MGFMEEILKNKEEILVKFFNVLEGKEASATVDLDGVRFKVGKNEVRLEGQVTFTFSPRKK